MIQVSYSYKGKKRVKTFQSVQIIVGRQKKGVVVDLNLVPDLLVSRQHARIWRENGQYWIEDLNSTRGTKLNGEEIKAKGKRPLQENDSLKMGDTALTIEMLSDEVSDEETTHPHLIEDLDEITPTIDANIPAFSSSETVSENILPRLLLFYELPLQMGEETRLDSLLQLIVERITAVIPGAERGAVLIKDRSGRLALKAHLPAGNPIVSLTIAQQSMEQHRAFIWPPPLDLEKDGDQREETRPPSVVEYQIESAMYAPLLWRGEALGVVCVHNCTSCNAFSSDDLKLLQAVAHHAALAVANLQLQETRQYQTEVQKSFYRLIPRHLSERLQNQRGNIRLGGDFHDATILISDIRGFTNLSMTMSPNDVAQMLEDYFGRLVPIVFKYHGAVDKYVGDAILAVFGSPDPDENQQLHAIQAALEMQQAMQEVNARRDSEGKRIGELGIGIHCGEVVHGFIGTSERMEFTVIGDTVNRASRYCDGARGGEVLVSSDVYQWVWKSVETEPTSIATKHEGNFTAYRIKSLK